MSDERQLGEALVEGKVITRDQLDECLEIQQNLAELGSSRSLEQVLRDQGYLKEGPSKLSTIPPNSMRRIKCQNCGARALVEPGQHEREVVCRKCGEYAVKTVKTAGMDDLSAPVDFNPVMPSLDLFSAAGGGKQKSETADGTERTMALNYGDDEPPAQQVVMGGAQATPRKSGPKKARGGRPISERKSAQRRPSRQQSSRVSRGDGRRPPKQGAGGGGGMVIVASLLAVLLIAGALAYMNKAPDGPEVVGVGSGSATAPSSGGDGGSGDGGDDSDLDGGDVGTDSGKGNGGDDGGDDGGSAVAPTRSHLAAYRAAVKAGDDEAAFEALASHLEANPGDLKLQRELVEIGERIGKTDELVDALTRLAESPPDAEAALRKLGEIHFDEGSFSEAATVWERLLARKPDPLLTAKIAQARMESGQWLRCIDTIGKLDRPYAGEVDTIVRGLVPRLRARARRDWPMAIANSRLPAPQAKRALILAVVDGQDYFPSVAAGYYHMQVNEHDKAVVAFTRAMQMPRLNNQPKRFELIAIMLRARSYVRINQHEKAMEDALLAINNNRAVNALHPLATLLHALHGLKRTNGFKRTLVAYLWVCREAGANPPPNLPRYRQLHKELTGSDQLPPGPIAMGHAEFQFVIRRAHQGSPFENGDRINAVNGNPLTSLQMFRTHMQGVMQAPNGSTKFAILRQGTKMEVTVTNAQMRQIAPQLNASSWQIYLKPASLKD